MCRALCVHTVYVKYFNTLWKHQLLQWQTAIGFRVYRFYYVRCKDILLDEIMNISDSRFETPSKKRKSSTFIEIDRSKHCSIDKFTLNRFKFRFRLFPAFHGISSWNFQQTVLSSEREKKKRIKTHVDQLVYIWYLSFPVNERTNNVDSI